MPYCLIARTILFHLFFVHSFQLNSVVHIRLLAVSQNNHNNRSDCDTKCLSSACLSIYIQHYIRGRSLTLLKLSNNDYTFQASITKTANHLRFSISNSSQNCSVNNEQLKSLDVHVSNIWRNVTIEQHNILLKLMIKYTCLRERYGVFCEEICRPKSTYTCSENGSIICNEGWKGPLCRIAICKNNCSGNDRFKCVAPDKCKCIHGWTGDNCETCIRSSLCAHGFCTRPFGCICRPGWTGSHCNIAEFAFKLPTNNCSCLNGGLCEYIETHLYKETKCICPAYFTGELCEIPVNPLSDLSICTRGFCLNKGECFSNGRTAVCQCDEKWTGQRCTIRIEPCMTNPCLNNGTCRIYQKSSDFVCHCTNEFHGKLCELKRANMYFAIASPSTHNLKAKIFLILSGSAIFIISALICILYLTHFKQSYIAKVNQQSTINEESPPPPYGSEECTELLSLLAQNREFASHAVTKQTGNHHVS
ncbi:hypothetical protein GJ496_003179 [Pomphorhynchus laevis]|nr:hypothetical protein GJ496_003179 [Pomphorhynchus laevis]